MSGREHQDQQLEEFIAARTQDLHHDAYQLTGAQQTAEQLMVTVLADMRRASVDLARAGEDARLRMARATVRDDSPTESADAALLPVRFQALARLSPRQRAVLLLQVVDNFDERETARALQLSVHATTAALRSIPYDELPGATPHSGELRSLMEDFGDLATAPSPTTTLTDVRAVPPPPKRPWWSYVAAFLVIALTVATLVVTQRWHDDWLRTADGLNHTHGTHFPAYTQGYKLVAIRDVAPGPAEDIDAGKAGALAMNCADLSPATGMAVSSEESSGSYFQRGGCRTTHGYALTPASGRTLVSINDFNRGSWPVAVYRQVPLSQYPVATGHFDVQRDITLDSLRVTTAFDGTKKAPLVKGTVLTLHGTRNHPNGTFRGMLRLPSGPDGTDVNVVGLLSPTTTGRYLLRADGHVPWTTCGTAQTMSYQDLQHSSGCSLVDHHVPQVTFELSHDARTMTIEIAVTDARGPWELQVVGDCYKVDAGTD